MIRAALLVLLATPSQAAVVHFCWVGSAGYSMTGRMEFPDALLGADVVTEADVTAFRITGFRDGARIGTWDVATREADDIFILFYLPKTMHFPTNGEMTDWLDQAWNADGTASDCGPGGFGFNAAGNAQDVCVDGTWIRESGVPPPTPFHAQAKPPESPDCGGPALVSKRRGL